MLNSFFHETRTFWILLTGIIGRVHGRFRRLGPSFLKITFAVALFYWRVVAGLTWSYLAPSHSLLAKVQVTRQACSYFVTFRSQTEYCDEFTSNLEGIFKDVSMSMSMMEDFKEYLYYPTISFNFAVHALNSRYWPSVAITQIRLPSPLANAYETFKNYYEYVNNAGRLGIAKKLRAVTLLPQFGYAELYAMFYGLVCRGGDDLDVDGDEPLAGPSRAAEGTTEGITTYVTGLCLPGLYFC